MERYIVRNKKFKMINKATEGTNLSVGHPLITYEQFMRKITRYIIHAF